MLCIMSSKACKDSQIPTTSRYVWANAQGRARRIFVIDIDPLDFSLRTHIAFKTKHSRQFSSLTLGCRVRVNTHNQLWTLCHPVFLPSPSLPTNPIQPQPTSSSPLFEITILMVD